MLYDLAIYHLIDVDARQSDPSAAGPQSEPFVLMDAGSVAPALGEQVASMHRTSESFNSRQLGE
jgi:hypothetical protein